MGNSPAPVKWWLGFIRYTLLLGTATQLSLTVSPLVHRACQRVVVVKDASCLYSYVECNSLVEETLANPDEEDVEVTRTIFRASLDVVLAGANTSALKDDRSGFPPCIVKVPQSARVVNLPCCLASSDSPSHILASCDQIGPSSTFHTTWFKTDVNGVPQKYKRRTHSETCLNYMPSGSEHPSPATKKPMSPATTQPGPSSTPTQPLTGTPPAWPPLWPPFPWPSSPPSMKSSGEGSKGSGQAPCSRSLRLRMTDKQMEGMYMCSMKVSQPTDQSASATWTKRHFIVSKDKHIDDTSVSPIDCHTVNIFLRTFINKSAGEAADNVYKATVVRVAKGTKVCLRVHNPTESLKWFYIDNIEQVSVGLHSVSQPPSKSLVSSTLPGIGIAGLKREMVMIEEMQKQFQGTYGFVVKPSVITQAGAKEDVMKPAADGDLMLLVKVELKEDEPLSAKIFYFGFIISVALLAICLVYVAYRCKKRIDHREENGIRLRYGVQPTSESDDGKPLLEE